MINLDYLEKYNKELKSQNKNVAKVVKELDNYFFGFLKMAIEYVYTLYEDKNIDFSIEPCGDYYNNTYNLNISPISYLVVYNVKRKDMQTYLNNKILKEKYTSKKLKSIIGAVPEPAFPTNDEIATRIYRFMDRFIDLDNKSFCAFGTIRYGLEKAYQVKIVVAYKYEDGTYVFTDNNKVIEIDLNKIHENIRKKDKQTGKEYTKVCALFKSFETELLCANKIEDVLMLKNYFVEQILYNVPDELFMEKDLSVKIDKIIKYLKFANVYKFKNLDDSLITDKARISYIKKFIKRMSVFNNIGTSILLNIFN